MYRECVRWIHGYMDEWGGVDGWYIKTIIAFRETSSPKIIPIFSFLGRSKEEGCQTKQIEHPITTVYTIYFIATANTLMHHLPGWSATLVQQTAR